MNEQAETKLRVIGEVEMIDRPLQTFSVGFKQRAFSELDYARQVAQAIKADAHEVVIDDQDPTAHAPAILAVKRRHHLGQHVPKRLRRALGARKWHIKSQFLAETLLIILLGGAIGIGEIAVINNACLRLEPPFGVNRTRNEHEEN